MYSKKSISKISEILFGKRNRRYTVVCQENFIKKIPLEIIKRIVTVVVAEDLNSASSLRNFMHTERIQNYDIDIIVKEQFKHYNLNFDFIFIDKETENITQFISYVTALKRTADKKIAVICNKELCHSLFDRIDLKWCKFHDNWMNADLILKKNIVKKNEQNSKFVDEDAIEDDYAEIF